MKGGGGVSRARQGEVAHRRLGAYVSDTYSSAQFAHAARRAALSLRRVRRAGLQVCSTLWAWPLRLSRFRRTEAPCRAAAAVAAALSFSGDPKAEAHPPSRPLAAARRLLPAPPPPSSSADAAGRNAGSVFYFLTVLQSCTTVDERSGAHLLGACAHDRTDRAPARAEWRSSRSWRWSRVRTPRRRVQRQVASSAQQRPTAPARTRTRTTVRSGVRQGEPRGRAPACCEGERGGLNCPACCGGAAGPPEALPAPARSRIVFHGTRILGSRAASRG